MRISDWSSDVCSSDLYLDYLVGILQVDFGPSLKIRDFSVGELIAAGAPASMQLGISAILLALLIGISLGSLAALRQNSAVDFAVMSVSLVGIAVPNFVMAPLMSLAIGRVSLRARMWQS